MGKVNCEVCKKKCVGNALRVQDRFFHLECFKCAVCSSSLSMGGFFLNEGNYYCTSDYQRLFGTKCASCGNFVEGEVVTALGNTYHQKCFKCARCRQTFPAGDKVTFNGKECLCQKCVQIPIANTPPPASYINNGQNGDDRETESPLLEIPKCAGCNEELTETQTLIALNNQWHIWCLKCVKCGSVLHGEYMEKDGVPYCEKDYQKEFGVKCSHCDLYILGKVLQAGDNHRFHPTCARCSKCGDPFGDGEEMCMQGGAIWHPKCGPEANGKYEEHMNGDHKSLDGQIYNFTSTPPSSHSTSPAFNKKHYGRASVGSYPDKDITAVDLSRFYTYSYLTAEPTQGYLRRLIEPHPPKSPQFHRPPEHQTRRSVISKILPSKQGMQVLVESIQSTTPRPKSPHMNNEEPIELAHYPGATKPRPNDVAKIDRDDFPAPPFPYTDPDRRRRWSGSSKEFDHLEDEEEDESLIDPKLKKEEEELSKIATGIGKVFLQTVKEREKLQAYKRSHLDPRKSSRTPAANKEVQSRLRYDSPIHASPSRDVNRPKPWEEEEFDRSSGFRGSFGRTFSTPSYNAPRPGYGLAGTKSATLPGTGRDGGLSGYMSSDLSFDANLDQSLEFGGSTSRSDVSPIPENDITPMNHSSSVMFHATPSSERYNNFKYSYSPHLRLSMPNVNLHSSNDPPKLYPYHLLVTENYRLPPDVDRCHLERHLSNEEFGALFHMSRLEFYKMPEWKRNDIKRRARLF